MKYLAIIATILLIGCSTQKKLTIPESNVAPIQQEPISGRIAFYNVENLFDTINSPNTKDEDFLPEAKSNWNTPKYVKKLNHIAEVIKALDFPLVMGLCEVENATVVNDLIHQNELKDKNYALVHYESSDERGIDCALIYQSSKYKVTNSKTIKINFPADISKSGDGYTYTTRDVLRVDGVLGGKEKVTFFVNHWPSRGRDGQQKSEARRVYVANVLKKEVDGILKNDPNANIIIMGDLNDETDNISVSSTLGAKDPSLYSTSTLINWMIPLDNANTGSHNYKGEWNMLDHIISTSTLANPNSTLKLSNPTIFKEDFILYYDKKANEKLPSRTYVGEKYYGGYSDHLPVYIQLNSN